MIAGYKYVHIRTNNTYRVLMLANEFAEERITQVVYQGEDGKIWARPLTEFLDKFTKIEEKNNYDH